MQIKWSSMRENPLGVPVPRKFQGRIRDRVVRAVSYRSEVLGVRPRWVAEAEGTAGADVNFNSVAVVLKAMAALSQDPAGQQRILVPIPVPPHAWGVQEVQIPHKETKMKLSVYGGWGDPDLPRSPAPLPRRPYLCVSYSFQFSGQELSCFCGYWFGRPGVTSSSTCSSFEAP